MHSATFPGKTVYVVLKNGLSFTDIFLERTKNKDIIFKEHGRIAVRDIKQFICGSKMKKHLGS